MAPWGYGHVTIQVVVVVPTAVVGGVVVDVVGDGIVVVVEVVVVVAGGITKPLAHPHLMSVGAPTGNPIVDGCASR